MVNFAIACSLFDDDISFLSTQLYWISAVYVLICGSLNGITRVITPAAVDGEATMRILKKYAVTWIGTVPTYLAQWLQSPHCTADVLRSLRVCMCGGERLPPELLQQLNRLLPQPVVCAYGMSEAAGLVACQPEGDPVDGSSGRLLPGESVIVLNRMAERCAPGEDGELCIRFPMPMGGYYANAAETRRALDEDGWWHTGDVGHFDEAGNLFVVSRINDFIRCWNMRVSPTEIEDIVLKVDGVAAVCVVGLADTVNSDVPAAVVIRTPGAMRPVQAEDIVRSVAERLCVEKHLRGGVYFVEQFPTTDTGKLRRREVQVWAEKVRDVAKAQVQETY